MKKNIWILAIAFVIITLIFGASFIGCAKEEKPTPVKVGRSAEKAPAVSPAAPSAPATPRVVEPAPVVIPTLEKVYFDFNKYGPKTEGYEVIATVSDWMKKNASYKVKVDGHADTQGDAVYNQNLSELRANYVKKLLVKSGVSEDRIITQGFGEEKPISKKNPENRRVEFTIQK
jgi:outer membrane protein OmpA-like peptidoglycan-associated protein